MIVPERVEWRGVKGGGKEESEERQMEHKSGEKLLPAAEELSGSLLSLRSLRKVLYSSNNLHFYVAPVTTY